MALAEARDDSRGAIAYVTLEPCAHESERGLACVNLLVDSGVARAVVAVRDPDSRTNGRGLEDLRTAGIAVVTGVESEAAERSMAGFLMRHRLGRPFVTLKLAMSIDGKIALPSGESRWITGEDARAHVHGERARADMLLVGRGTYEADGPRLDVSLPGLEERSPRRAILTRGATVEASPRPGNPAEVHTLRVVTDTPGEGGTGGK